MTLPLYQRPENPREVFQNGHRGLWFERFFDHFDAANEWQICKSGKSRWVEENAQKTGDPQALETAVLRHLSLITECGGRGAVFQCDWHFATGLGLPHPVENGLAWHPTLGVPYLAGSGVKGLVKAWVEIWDEHLSDAAQRQARLDTWFGNQERAGQFIFFDALPVEPVYLRADVMTPHQGDWYAQGGKPLNGHPPPANIPADWHEPVPIPFLVARRPKLLFGIAPRLRQDTAAANELAAVMAALKQALAWLGAGAKTAVGYGQMHPDTAADQHLQQAAARRQAQEREREATRQREAERQRALAQMDPFERHLQELIDTRPDPNQNPINYILKQAKEGRWQGEEKQQVAAWLQRHMQAEKGQWREKSDKKKPEKDQPYQNTLLVMKWLGERG